MSCYHPIAAWKCADGGVVFVNNLRRHDIVQRMDLPCGQCIGCRLRRARDWSVRIMHEAQTNERSCFVTLTYDEENLPVDGSLKYRDFQLFMKRLRALTGVKVRFFMCGEYGPLNLRPHYHACIFGEDFRNDRVAAGTSESGERYYESQRLSTLWRKGKCSVQDLTLTSAAYTARYVVDKITGDAAEEHYGGREPEFMRCSLKPGIGYEWFKKFGMGDIYRHDVCVISGGRMETAPPKYYDKLYRRTDKTVQVDEWEYARQLRAKAALEDNTEERLLVKEKVQQARISNQRRTL